MFARLRGQVGTLALIFGSHAIGHSHKNCITRIALVFEAFLYAVLEKPLYAKPPFEFRKPEIVWKVKKVIFTETSEH